MPRQQAAVVVLLVLAGLAGFALIIVAMPGTMGRTLMPWEYVGVLLTVAMAWAAPLVVPGLAGLAAAAILLAAVWLSRRAGARSLPPLRPVRRKAELEELLAQPRSHDPDRASVALLIGTLQHSVDRTVDALEATDRKAGVLLGAILGIGVLNADRLRPPGGLALLPFGVAIGASLAAVAASLVVLWSRVVHTGPDAIRAAQATEWKELPFSQSIADSLAIAATENLSVVEVKGTWLNIAFTSATIAVIAFAILGIFGA